jgi:hypothetical protein
MLHASNRRCLASFNQSSQKQSSLVRAIDNNSSFVKKRKPHVSFAVFNAATWPLRKLFILKFLFTINFAVFLTIKLHGRNL